MPHIPPPSSIPPGSIIDAYLRDSGGLKQDRSVTRQLEALTEYCAQYNLILRTRYADVAKSGTTTAGRQNFQRMIADYEDPAKRPVALLIWNYARFARDVDDSQLYKALVRKWGITIHSLTDDIPEGRFGRLIELLIEVSNEEKAHQTATDAADGLRSIVMQGAMPGIPPRGFKRAPIVTINYRTGEKRTNHRWVPDPDWIPRIRKAFKMKAAGASVQQIDAETHIFASQNSYTTFFANRLYIGILDFGEQTIESYCEPMIDRKTWDDVQAILALHADRQHISTSELHPRRRSERATYLLSSIIHCARCGSPLWGMTSGQRNGSAYTRYACTRQQRRRDCDLKPIPSKALESEVINKLTVFFEDPANLQALLEEDREYLLELDASKDGQVKALQKELTPIKRSISRITKAIKAHGHSKALLKELTSLEAQETSLQSKLEAVKTKSSRVPLPLTAEQVAGMSHLLANHLRSKDNILVRSVLYGIVESLTVDRTPEHVMGVIKIHSPREPETEPDAAPFITASIFRGPVGAPSHTRSISFQYEIKRPHH